MHVDIQPFAEYAVAPYMGAWIETHIMRNQEFKFTSHPTWVRGLKPVFVCHLSRGGRVAPYMGAWIETDKENCSLKWREVAPYMGAWIETLVK